MVMTSCGCLVTIMDIDFKLCVLDTWLKSIIQSLIKSPCSLGLQGMLSY